ncbi:MAG TPA: Lrp/AsnC family transcriptional regulator [Burkholderiales bacterium]|nr:Lrp/AsnC family transcriptional regulator [Burkholderiales bacterium]
MPIAQDAEFPLLNEFQRDFPLVSRPFAEVAARCGLTEAQALGAYRAALADGLLSRIGVVFAPHAVGASTLAAMAVPPSRIDAVAKIVSAQPEVNHNYEREHRVNLWFVATAPSQEALEAALARIARESGIEVLALPLVEEYHIDLGFDLAGRTAPRAPRPPVATVPLDAAGRRLLAAVEDGFPLEPEPYAALARAAGMREGEVIATLAGWLAAGVARRVGVVLRHRELGYTANAMAVWDVPDSEVSAAGMRLARRPEVTLCYRRARQAPVWPYNLYCMIHGRNRQEVSAQLAALNGEVGLARTAHAVLFSRRAFKQRGARYADNGSDDG